MAQGAGKMSDGCGQAYIQIFLILKLYKKKIKEHWIKIHIFKKLISSDRKLYIFYGVHIFDLWSKFLLLVITLS